MQIDNTTFNENEINLILEGLGELKASRVYSLLKKIEGNYIQSIKEKQEKEKALKLKRDEKTELEEEQAK